MDNNNVFNWKNVNSDVVANFLFSPKINNDGEVVNDPSRRATVKLVEEYNWEDEVVVNFLMWDTPKISHILKHVADQIFDDVESAFVGIDPRTGKPVGTLYFQYNAERKSDHGFLAFSSLTKGAIPKDFTNQVLLRIQQQNYGEVVVTKEGMDIMSNWINTDLDKSDPNWPKKIDWKKYADVVMSGSKTGCSIRLSNINMNVILSMIIRTEKKIETKSDGTTVEVSRPLFVEVDASSRKAQGTDLYYAVKIYDLERSKTVTDAVYGCQRIFAGNPYESYN